MSRECEERDMRFFVFYVKRESNAPFDTLIIKIVLIVIKIIKTNPN